MYGCCQLMTLTTGRAMLLDAHRLDVTEIAPSIAWWKYFLQCRWTMQFRSLTLPDS